MKNNAKFMKKLKYGSMAAVITAIVIAIVIVLNIVMSSLMKRYPIKFDLTSDNRYELCSESKTVLKNMKSDVEIAVMYPEETLKQMNYYNMIPAILEKYQVYANQGKGNVDIKYYDITKDPDVVSKYSKNYNGTITQGSVVVSCGDKVKVANIKSFFTQDSSSQNQTQSSSQEQKLLFVGESTITSDIMSVTDANPLKAGVLAYLNGDGSTSQESSSSQDSSSQTIFSDMAAYPVSQLYSLLDSNGYTCSEVTILKDKLSADDYNLLVIPAPESDFTPDVISKLEDFLYNGGKYGRNILYIPSPTAKNLPNIQGLLAKWSIQVEDSYVLDDDSSISASLQALSGQSTMAPTATISNTDAVGELPNASLPIAVPYSRAITLLSKNSDVTASAILQSSKTSYQRPLDSGENFKSSDAKKDVNNLVTISTRKVQLDNTSTATSSILVFGSLFIADPSVMGNTSAYNNANFVLNTVNKMTGKENSVVIPQKNLEQHVITVSKSQLGALRAAVVYIIPAFVVVCGLVVFVRRKNK